jgi:hypothetical protein
MDVSHIALAQVTISVAKTDFEISSKPTLRVPSGGSQMRHKQSPGLRPSDHTVAINHDPRLAMLTQIAPVRDE